MNTTPADFSSWLRGRMKARGFTQTSLAAALRLDGHSTTRQSVNQWQNGRRLPGKALWGSLAYALGVDLVTLMAALGVGRARS